MSEFADAIREQIEAEPTELVINGKPLTGWAGPVVTDFRGEVAAERQRDIAYIGEPPQGDASVGVSGESWTPSDYEIHGDAVTATVTSEK